MALRCLLFCSDAGTATPVLQVLAGLDVEGEHCSDAVATVEKVTHQSFQIVIIDWDQQPEAGLLLTAARERKASERPLTLAIVSDDVSVPQALQAGANSILRKPIMLNQVKDTLTTARDLLRSKQESAMQAAAAGASSGSVSTIPSSLELTKDKALRAGEFLHSAGTAPGGQFETDSDVHESLAPTSAEPVDPLKDLEPTAASMSTNAVDHNPAPTPPPPLPPPVSSEPRGLEWYLKTRAGATSTPVSAPTSPPPAPGKPEMVGFDQPYSPTPDASSGDAAQRPAPEANSNQPDVPDPRREPKRESKQEQKNEQKREAELFAYIEGGSADAEEKSGPRFRHKGAIIGALALASLAIGIAPQAPWHPKLHTFWIHEQQALRGWLNPQPVTPPQAPAAHEDFGRAGDEYKLPVAETIPDATTDPSQIQVLPVVDPTIKKPNSLGGNAIQATPDATTATPVDRTPQVPPSGAQAPDNQPPQTVPQSTQPSTVPVDAPPPPTTVAPVVTTPQHSDPFTAAPPPVASAVRPAPPKIPEQHTASTPANVPSSLKSHMASMTPDAGGNKSPESAMQSIEPVSIPELTERALLIEQPEIAYPTNPKAQPGTVILQVLIGRDGTVQDAKFMQGSLAFARSAIDGVKLWKFKPYVMNGRPVSVQTLLTISFKAAS